MDKTNNINSYTFDEIYIGLSHSFETKITQQNMESFYKITSDCNPLHLDSNYAIENGFDSNVVYGLLTSSFFSTFAGVYLPGRYSLIHEVQFSFLKPVYINDILYISGEVVEKQDVYKQIKVKVNVNKNNDKDSIRVLKGYMKVGVMK